ncbi:MAG: hypothetical protein BJ554DRAFT_10 [Olpidium bornovanus]|uniref:Uncharacterized protein n=1 Tax=Olpidium bornovanus TaxID=278681 RepID=A0A8H8DMM2_9FUNG|nr:MAG: hypothetical protein BJ554DRAFT_10 [Olpidium bornovanus]
MRSWQAEFVRQLLWGPMRDSDAFKQQAALAMKAEAEERADCVALERDTAAVVFSQSDYLVRVQVQSVVIHWDPENPAHIDLAEDLFARLMDTAQTRVKHVVYQNQLEYRIKVGCGIEVDPFSPRASSPRGSP